MSAETSVDARLELIRRAYEALEAGDRDALVAMLGETMHPDCEWVPFLSGVEGRTYSGHDGMREFFSDFLGAFTVTYDIETLRPVGSDAILMLGAMNLRGRESGVDVTQEMGVLFEFEDGLIRRGKASDRATAIATAEALSA